MTTANKQKRISSKDAALLLIDHQTGLCNGVTDMTLPEFHNNVSALAKLGKLFQLPTVVTASAPSGPNGPLIPHITKILPDVQIIARPGEINPWDNPQFYDAVKKTGRKQLIIAGVSTDVCVAFPALAAVAEGYEVYAVIDASGTWSKTVQEVAIQRMAQAGVQMMNWVAVGAELQRDWRHETTNVFGQIMGEHLPFYGNVIASYMVNQK